MISSQEILPVGVLRKTHGKQGELCLTVKSDLLDSFTPRFVVLEMDGINVPFVVESMRQHGSDWLLRLEDINTEERARALQGKQVAVLRRELPQDYDEQLPVEDLVGFSVFDMNGKFAGKITAVDDQTANLLIELDNGVVLPLHDDLVEELSIEERKIVMSIPEGLMEI